MANRRKVKKLDVSQSCLLGISGDRKNQIANPAPLTCDGCGVTVYVSKQMIEPAKRSALERRHKLYIVCRQCAEPFLDEVAAGGELEAASVESLNLDGVLDAVNEKRRKRRRFFENN